MELEGVDRRHFIFTSLITAAASTFGFGATALAQTPPPAAGGRAGGAGQGQAPPPAPLGNGEPISWTFQPYPQGTGALMEKLIRERGAAAFTRSTFTVDKWAGAVPTSGDDIAFLPAHRLSALIKEKKITSTELTKIYLDRLKKFDPVAAVRRHDHGRAGHGGSGEGRRGDQGRQIPRSAARHSVRHQGSVLDQGRAHDLGRRRFREPHHRRGRRDRRAAARGGRGAHRQAVDGPLCAGRPVVSRAHEQSVGHPARIERIVRRARRRRPPAGCVAFGIGTETSGSIVSPARECGLSALRPTFGRVSRHGGMVLAWSQDRVGPICRTVEDCAMVFNVIHGVDPKDPSTVTTPFQFDRTIKLASLRIGVDAGAPKEFIDVLKELGAVPKEIGARPAGGGGGFGAESAAAFDFYVQAKAKEFGVDLATLPEPARGGGAGGSGRRSRCDGCDWTTGATGTPPARCARPVRVARRRAPPALQALRVARRCGWRRRSRQFRARDQHGGSHAVDGRTIPARVRLHPAAAAASGSHHADVRTAEGLRHVRARQRLRRRTACANRSSVRRRALQVRFTAGRWRRWRTRAAGAALVLRRGRCRRRGRRGGRNADTDTDNARDAARRLQQAADLLR